MAAPSHPKRKALYPSDRAISLYATLAPILLAHALLTPQAQASDFFGPGTYPQFRAMSGLPGNGFALTPEGRPGFAGALSFATPVAYSLAPNRYNIGLNVLSATARPAFGTRSGATEANGGAQILYGIPLPESTGRWTFSHLVLSQYLDHAQNLHWQPPTPQGQPQSAALQFAIGVQDISGQGGTSGETDGPRRFDPGESRSYYAVATTRLAPSTFASLGFGDGRFKGRFFANASHDLTPRLKAAAEWDTFNANLGLAYSLGPLPSVNGTRPLPVLTLGYADFRRFSWSVTVSF